MHGHGTASACPALYAALTLFTWAATGSFVDSSCCRLLTRAQRVRTLAQLQRIIDLVMYVYSRVGSVVPQQWVAFVSKDTCANTQCVCTAELHAD
jgi:hypothetical protein